MAPKIGLPIQNDLLTFLICKMDSLPRTKLLKCTLKFYSKESIEDAGNVLFSAVPSSYFKIGRKSNTLAAIYDCLNFLQPEKLPKFICVDINNIPPFAQEEVESLKGYNHIKEELMEYEDCKIEIIDSENESDEEDPMISHYTTELEDMKLEVNDIYASVLQMKEQIDQIINMNPSNQSPEKKRKLEYTNSDDKDKSGITYFHNIIDDEQIGKDSISKVCWNEDVEIDENIVVVPQSLNSWLSDDANERTKGSVKSSEKIIYIKDESEDFGEFSSEVLAINDKENDTDSITPLDACDSVEEEDTFIVDMSRPNQCDICNKSFPTLQDLQSHMNVHPPRKQFDCILCEKSFRSRKDLRSHFLLCFKDNEERLLLDGLICNICGRMYGDAAALRQHKTVHSIAKPHECPHCTYRYLSKKSLDTHIKTIHNKLNKFFCPFCDHSYISNNYLLNHIRSHTGEKPFKCNQCDYKAATPTLVARHVKRHQIQEEYSCDICDYVCRGTENLRSHKSKMHRNNLISCRVCGKSFKNATIYHNHFLTHSGEKTYKCSLCPYAGLTKATLTSHMKIHSGTDLMKCPHCAMPFRTTFSLRRHIRTHKET